MFNSSRLSGRPAVCGWSRAAAVLAVLAATALASAADGKKRDEQTGARTQSTTSDKGYTPDRGSHGGGAGSGVQQRSLPALRETTRLQGTGTYQTQTVPVSKQPLSAQSGALNTLGSTGVQGGTPLRSNDALGRPPKGKDAKQSFVAPGGRLGGSGPGGDAPSVTPRSIGVLSDESGSGGKGKGSKDDSDKHGDSRQGVRQGSSSGSGDTSTRSRNTFKSGPRGTGGVEVFDTGPSTFGTNKGRRGKESEINTGERHIGKGFDTNVAPGHLKKGGEVRSFDSQTMKSFDAKAFRGQGGRGFDTRAAKGQTEKNLDVKKLDAEFRKGHAGSRHTGDAKLAGKWSEELKKDKLDRLAHTSGMKKFDAKQQFDIREHKGDLAVKVHFGEKLHRRGGWRNRWVGHISVGYVSGCFPMWYCGTGYFPSYCWYPRWSPWVSWCWAYPVDPWFAPPPWWCSPWVYDPCPHWAWWEYPVWVPMPLAVSGTWVDVPPVVVESGLDLQLLAVRFVDPGHPEEHEGPRFRVSLRNNSAVAIRQPFNVLLLAANSREPQRDLPQAGVRVTSIEPGQIQAVDVRLPFEANGMNRTPEGQPVPFAFLHVLIDAHQEIREAFKDNNGSVLARGDVLPVDPVLFGTDAPEAPAGAEITLAGEGFGPEAGDVLVTIGGAEMHAEIVGWYDLGVRIKLPALPLAGPTEAEVVVVRGDSAVSNPLTIHVTTPVARR